GAAGTRSGCAGGRRPPRPPRMALTRSGARRSALSCAVPPFPGASTPGPVLGRTERYTAFTRLHTLLAYLMRTVVEVKRGSASQSFHRGLRSTHDPDVLAETGPWADAGQAARPAPGLGRSLPSPPCLSAAPDPRAS